jgi:hypothetical protein
MTRFSVLLAVAGALAACSDRDAPRPVTDLGSPAPAAPSLPAAKPPVAPSADPNDPVEPGIPDLARLARYVFRTMQHHEAACPLENPFRETLHFAFMIEVANGRMTRVALSEVAVQDKGARRPLSKARRPPEVAGYLACLEPHLKAVAMSPAPADGLYEPAYSYGGRPNGKPAP